MKVNASPQPARLSLRLAILHGAASLGLGIWVPFFPTWLQGRGLTAQEIGIVTAIPGLVRILVARPILGLLDRGLGIATLMVAASLAVAAAYVGLGLVSGFAAIFALVAVAAAGLASIVPASDLVTMEAIRRERTVDYGRVRLWGSIAFLAAGIVEGYLLLVLPVESIVWTLALTAVVTVPIVWAVTPRWTAPEPAPAAAAANGASRRLPLALALVIAAAAFVQGSHAAIYGFGSIHWAARGYAPSTIGYLWAIGVVAEIALFAFVGRHVARGEAALGLMAFGALAGFVRFGALALDPDLPATFLLQSLHGVSFGATHLGTLAALNAYAPPGARGRAQGTLSAAIALAMAGSAMLSGQLYPGLGASLFGVMAGLSFVGLCLVALAARSRLAPPRG